MAVVRSSLTFMPKCSSAVRAHTAARIHAACLIFGSWFLDDSTGRAPVHEAMRRKVARNLIALAGLASALPAHDRMYAQRRGGRVYCVSTVALKTHALY